MHYSIRNYKQQHLPWKNIQPCGILDHHIRTKRKIEIGQHHNKGSCDQETTSPNNKDSAHKPCSFCHLSELKKKVKEKSNQLQNSNN
jgi:hypothetical protein